MKLKIKSSLMAPIAGVSAFMLMRSMRKRSLTPRKNLSLSDYFPAGTNYFYAYPAGEASGFLNRVPPRTEELVAARPLACAGPNVSVIAFAATQPPALDKNLLKKLGIPRITPKQNIILPESINSHLKGPARNQAIKAALAKLVRPKSLVMAQPFTDQQLSQLHQIPPAITTWINDKKNMDKYIGQHYLSKRLALYSNGQEFAGDYQRLPLPYAVKVSSSSAGDGVYLCLTRDNVETAAEQIKHISGNILVEEYIEARKNYGVHFGIPSDPNQPIDIIGVNEQLTSAAGEFIGGIINSRQMPAELAEVKMYLLEQVLPFIRELGWYGVGCFDILADRHGQFHFIDCNFRMTGMSAYHFLLANAVLDEPILAFSGKFAGSQKDFERVIIPLAGAGAKPKIMQLISLSSQDGVWNFNGALMFKNMAELKQRAADALAAGISSDALRQIAQS